MSNKCSYRCDFCNALASTGDIGKTVEFERHLGDKLYSRTILQSDHFAVLASLGQIEEGYLLILCKPHYPSMSHLPLNYFEELNSIYRQTRLLLSQAYTTPVFFEHGPMPLGEDINSLARGGGSCVDHAHFHTVPISVDLTPFLKERFHWCTISNLEELRTQAERKMPYLFFETREGNRYAFDAPIAPSQYLRRLLAIAIGVPDRWNWRAYPEPDRVLATVRRLNNLSGESSQASSVTRITLESL